MFSTPHLDCSRCRSRFCCQQLHNLCLRCKSPLVVRYDLPSLRKRWKKADLATRPKDLWRYLEVLPLEDRTEAITLGEGYTPLLPLDRAGEELAIARLLCERRGR